MSKKFFFAIFVILAVLSSLNVSAVTESVSIDDYVLDFEYEEEDVDAGETFRLEVTVTNEAGENREGIEISLDLDSPFDNVGDDEKTINSLDDEESRTVSFRIEVDEDAEEDEYSIEFDFKDNVIDESDEFDIEVDSSNSELIVGNVQSLPSVISPDTEDIKLTVTIENIGGDDADSVRAKLNLPAGFSPSGSFSNTANLGTIAKSSSKDVVFFIDTDEFIESGNYQGVLSLEYENNGDSETDSIDFDLPVKGRPQFLIERVETNPNPLSLGEEGTMRVTIRNAGEEEGQETSIRVFENSDQPFKFNEKTNFIGDLRSGESGTGIITFETDGGEANDYIVRMQIRTINQGNVIVEEHSASVKIEESRGGGFGLALMFIVLILLVLGLILLFRRGKKK